MDEASLAGEEHPGQDFPSTEVAHLDERRVVLTSAAGQDDASDTGGQSTDDQRKTDQQIVHGALLGV